MHVQHGGEQGGEAGSGERGWLGGRGSGLRRGAGSDLGRASQATGQGLT